MGARRLYDAPGDVHRAGEKAGAAALGGSRSLRAAQERGNFNALLW